MRRKMADVQDPTLQQYGEKRNCASGRRDALDLCVRVAGCYYATSLIVAIGFSLGLYLLNWTAPVSRRSKVVNAAGARASISGSWVKGDMILSYLGRCRDLGGRQGAFSCVTCGPVHCDAGGIVGSSVRFDNAVHGPQASGRRLTARRRPRCELARRSSRRDPRPDG